MHLYIKAADQIHIKILPKYSSLSDNIPRVFQEVNDNFDDDKFMIVIYSSCARSG